MKVEDMTKEQILEWTTKEGAYEFGRQKGYNYGFSQGARAGKRNMEGFVKELPIVIEKAQKILEVLIPPDSKMSNNECITELLGILDHKDVIKLQKRVNEEVTK